MLPLTKRQREILDYLNDFIQQHGYAPSLEEIGRRFSLSSLATVHKHLTNLQDKGFIKRAWNRSRSVEVVSAKIASRAVELPMLGYVAAGSPIEAVVGRKAKVNRLPEQPGDVPLTCADISKARRLLGYNPTTKLPDGLPKFVEWFRAQQQ